MQNVALFIRSLGKAGRRYAIGSVMTLLICPFGLASASTFTVDPEPFSNMQPYAKDALSPDWLNSPGRVEANDSWTSTPRNYFVPAEDKSYLLRSKTVSRDLEVDTWTRNGLVFLRMTDVGKGIYFSYNGEVENGYFEIGIVTGAGENEYLQGKFYRLYGTDNLARVVENYHRVATEADYFTFGVEGFEIYAKYNGKEFLRFREYRHMEEGRIALKANTGYGFRRATARHQENPKPLMSDYKSGILDLRDFGLRSIQAAGSIAAGSNQLRLQTPSNPPFQRGDYVIVELGGEAGRGARGTVGVGGTWPEKSHPNAAAQNQDRSQPTNTIAWVETDGTVRQWDGATWYDIGTWINTDITPPSTNYYYYIAKAVPLALRAMVSDVSADGSVLTLSRSAKAAATSAQVYFDNALLFNKLGRSPQYDGEYNFPKVTDGSPEANFTAITPAGVTLKIPEGAFALGEEISFGDHHSWKVAGAGNQQTRLFSPKGVASASVIVVNSTNVIVRDFHLQGNARNEGFGLSYPGFYSQSFGGGVTQTDSPQGGTYPQGVLFYYGSDHGRAVNLRVTDVFTRAMGAAFSDNVWAENCHVVLNEGLRMYIQWMFQWSDAGGGGCTNCSLFSTELVSGFESFKSSGTQFINCSSTNGSMSFNSAGGYLVKNMAIHILPNSQPRDKWFSKHSLLVDINTNIRSDYAYENQGGVLENVTIIQTGYINEDKDILSGININDRNQNITVRGGLYSSPDYAPPSVLSGARGLNSTGTNTVVDGLRVIGKVNLEFGTDGYGNITLIDGIVRNCIADFINPLSANVKLENNRPNSNVAPALAAIPSQIASEGTTLKFTASAIDTNVPLQTLTFSLEAGAPPGANIDPALGAFAWTPNEEQGPGNYTVTVRVTDNGTPPLSAKQSFDVTVQEVNAAPVLTVAANQTVNEDTPLTLTVAAVDPDRPAQQLTFSFDGEVPADASIDPATGVFTWRPAEAQGPSTNVITVRVFDDGTPSLSSTKSFTVIVSEVNTAPILVPLQDVTINEAQPLTFAAIATDPDLPGQSLTFSLEAGAPAGASIHPTTGVLTWTPAKAQAPSTNAITVRITDSSVPPLSDTKTFTVIVAAKEPLNQPPKLSVRSLANGTLRLTITGQPERRYAIETSQDLKTWIVSTSDQTNASGLLDFTETLGAGIAHRFYRARLDP